MLTPMLTRHGLRERKKLQTRQLIHEAAARLFTERGFDRVTVAEIARLADVSEVTVFNYFPTKEDLVFSGQSSFEERLVESVRLRAPGESALATFERALLSGSRLEDPDAALAIEKGAALIAGSPSLQIREREVVNVYTHALAAVLAGSQGKPVNDLEAWTVANALMGVHAGLVAHVRARVLAGWRGPALARDAREHALAALTRLEAGLGDFAVATGAEDR